MNFIKLCENLLKTYQSDLEKHLPVILKKADIDSLEKSNPELKKMLDEVGTLTDSGAVELYSKAKSSYEIARIKIRSGRNVILSGFYSKSGDTVKYHINEGRKLSTGYKTPEKEKNYTGMVTPDKRFIPLQELEALVKSNKPRDEVLKILGGISKGIYLCTLKVFKLVPELTKSRAKTKTLDFEKFDEMVNSGTPISDILETFKITINQYNNLRKKRHLESTFSATLKKSAAIKKEDIEDLKNKGFNQKEICAILGLQKGQLERLMAKLGIESSLSNSKKTIKSITKEKIQELDAAGFKSKEIAEKLRISEDTLQKLRRKFGITTRFQDLRTNNAKIKPEDIIERLKKGMKVDEICTDLGISEAVYKKMVTKYHIPTKRSLARENIKKITKEILENALNQYNTMRQIAINLGVDVKTLPRLFAKFKINIPGKEPENPEIKQMLTEMLERGMTRKDILKQLGWSRAYYDKMITQNNITTQLQASHERVSKITKEILEQKLAEGKPYDKIASELEISKSALSRLLDKLKIETKKRKANECIKHITKDRLEECLRNGETMEQIYEKFGISEGAYYNLLLKYKIKTNLALQKDYINSITPEQIKEQLKKYSTTKEIVQHLNISLLSYRKLLEKFNLLPEVSRSKLKETIRSRYENYDTEKLKNRLFEIFLENNTIAKSKRLEEFIDFVFTDKTYINEHKKEFIGLIRVLDLVEKKALTLKEAGLNPDIKTLLTETRAITKALLDKQIRFEIHQTDYKEALDILLPQNSKSELSKICRKYLPASTEDKNYEVSKQILKLIKNTDFSSPLSARNLDISISRLDAFYSEKDEILLKQATEYAKKHFKSENPEKIGQYIINYKVLNNRNTANLSYPKDLTDIILKSSASNEMKLNYLMKLDEIFTADLKENLSINSLLKHFTNKDITGNKIIKQFIDTIYLKTDTIKLAEGLNNRKQEVKFCSKAKQEIIDYYGYPNCLQYLSQFERALEHFAPKDGKAGIKALTGHDKYDYEVKINDKTMRLVSSQNNFDFDTFIPEGFHRKR